MTTIKEEAPIKLLYKRKVVFIFIRLIFFFFFSLSLSLSCKEDFGSVGRVQSTPKVSLCRLHGPRWYFFGFNVPHSRDTVSLSLSLTLFGSILLVDFFYGENKKMKKNKYKLQREIKEVAWGIWHAFFLFLIYTTKHSMYPKVKKGHVIQRC